MGEQRGLAPLLTVDLAPVTVELNLRESGARFPCKWSSVLEIYIDGNKRIGAMVTQLLLKWNGYQFQLEQNELADMFIGIADGTKDETELRYWINDHIE